MKEAYKFHNPSSQGDIILVKKCKYLILLYAELRSDNHSYSDDELRKVYQNFEFHEPQGRGECSHLVMLWWLNDNFENIWTFSIPTSYQSAGELHGLWWQKKNIYDPQVYDAG